MFTFPFIVLAGQYPLREGAGQAALRQRGDHVRPPPGRRQDGAQPPRPPRRQPQAQAAHDHRLHPPGMEIISVKAFSLLQKMFPCVNTANAQPICYSANQGFGGSSSLGLADQGLVVRGPDNAVLRARGLD